MQSIEPQALHEVSARVGKLYMQRFRHPAYHRGLVDGLSRPLSQGESLQLMQEALKKGEPVPGWAEAYESNKAVRASKGRLT